MAVAPQQSILLRLRDLGRLSSGQMIGLMLGLSAAIALISGAWMWSQTPDYRVLYSNLSDRDGGAIINSLQQMNVQYKMAEGGGAILVPSGQVYEIRLRLASQGLPKGSVVGFELMENQKLGTSQFLEQVNYQRALEGELTRSIQSLSAVQGARLHLAIPRPSVFTRDQQKPSASVLVSLHPGRTLDKAQVNGIVHLVSSSVPDLPVQNVTIIDQNGKLLSAAADGKVAGLDPSQLEYLHQVEQAYIKRIESILSPITGMDNVRAQVTAELDFSQTDQTAEIFKPNPVPGEAAIRSQQINESIGTSGTPGGVPGALSNQPPGTANAPVAAAPAATAVAPAPAQPAVGSTRKESTVNYEVDKTIRHVKSPVGGVKRLSVAVVVNYKRVVDKEGKVGAKPLTAAEMTQISNLVKESMGYRQDRGDTLNVVNASFNTVAEEIPATPIWKDPATIALVKEIIRNLLIAGIVFFLVFKVLRPLLKELATPPPRPVAAPTIEGMMSEQAQVNYDDRLRAAKEMARQEPKVVASVVKEWIGGNE